MQEQAYMKLHGATVKRVDYVASRKPTSFPTSQRRSTRELIHALPQQNASSPIFYIQAGKSYIPQVHIRLGRWAESF